MEKLIAIYKKNVLSDYLVELLQVIDEDGPIDEDIVTGLFRNSFGSQRPERFFLNLDELRKFSYSLASQERADEVSLVSILEYNDVLREVDTTSRFFDALYTPGDKIQNVDKGDQNGLLSKIFN